MPNRITIYVQEDILRAVKRLDMNASHVCQVALENAVQARVSELQETITAGEIAQSLLEELRSSVDSEDDAVIEEDAA